MRDIDIQ